MSADNTNARALIDAYFAGWNAHDARAVAATFAAGGTYADPTTEAPIAGDQIAHIVEPLCAAFPDLTFECTSAVGEGGRYAVE